MPDDTTNAESKSPADRYASRPRAPDVQAATIKAAMAVRGFACRVCGCCDTRVEVTRKSENEVTRYRKCRNCGARITTLEVPVS